MKRLQCLLLTLIFGVNSVSSAATNGHFISQPRFAPAVAEESTGSDVEELLKAALELYKQQKYDEALANCRAAAALDAKDFRPHFFAGVIYRAQSKLESASEEFAKAIRLKPENKEIYLSKAKVDRMRGAKDEAIAACRKALAIDPSFAEAYLILGDTLRDDEKRRAEADAAYRAAIKADPNLPLNIQIWGERLLYANKDEKSAEEAFRQAMELDPKQMAGRFALGRLLVKQNRLKEAREIWEGRTTDKDNTFPNFITLLDRAERLKRATDALAQKPDDPKTLLEMGNAVMDGDHWVVDGRQEKAIVYFKKALAIKPDFAAAQYAVCKAYIQIADTSKEKNKNVDDELVKLRRMDLKLAEEMEEYRKTYQGGLRAAK